MVRRKSTRPKSSTTNTTTSKTTTTDKTGYKSNSQKTVTLVSKRNYKSRILHDIKTLQKSTKLILPKAPFARLVREIMFEIFPTGAPERIQAIALEALQEAAEMYIVQFFEDAVLLALHSQRVTLMHRDMVLLRRLRGRSDIINR